MEKIKDPAMLLSMTNSFGIVGIAAYFYKQLEAQRNDMLKISQTLGAVVKKLSDIEKGDQNKSETLHVLNEQIKQINDQMEDLPSYDMFSDMDLDLSEIVSTLDEANITVERPSQRTQRRSKPSDRKSGRQSTDDKRETNSRRNAFKTPDRTRSTFVTTETSREQDTRQPIRQPRDTRDTREFRESRESRVPISRTDPRQESRTESLSQDDDSELIGEVRRLAGRS